MQLEAESCNKPSLRHLCLVPPPPPGKLLQIVKCFWGNIQLCRQNLFRLHLLLSCAGLAADTAVVHPAQGRNRSAKYSLCDSGCDETERHFLIECPDPNL